MPQWAWRWHSPSLGYFGDRFRFNQSAAKANEEAALLNAGDPQRMLAEANRFYWGHNLPLALPRYQRAETLFTQAHDARDRPSAKSSVLCTSRNVFFPDRSEFIAAQLQTLRV